MQPLEKQQLLQYFAQQQKHQEALIINSALPEKIITLTQRQLAAAKSIYKDISTDRLSYDEIAKFFLDFYLQQNYCLQANICPENCFFDMELLNAPVLNQIKDSIPAEAPNYLSNKLSDPCLPKLIPAETWQITRKIQKIEFNSHLHLQINLFSNKNLNDFVGIHLLHYLPFDSRVRKFLLDPSNTSLWEPTQKELNQILTRCDINDNTRKIILLLNLICKQFENLFLIGNDLNIDWGETYPKTRALMHVYNDNLTHENIFLQEFGILNLPEVKSIEMFKLLLKPQSKLRHEITCFFNSQVKMTVIDRPATLGISFASQTMPKADITFGEAPEEDEIVCPFNLKMGHND